MSDLTCRVYCFPSACRWCSSGQREDSNEANTILHLFWRQTIKTGLAAGNSAPGGGEGSTAKALKKEIIVCGDRMEARIATQPVFHTWSLLS